MKSKNINKDVGDISKTNLSSFLRIRKKTLQQFLSENEVDTKEKLENLISVKLKNDFFVSKELLKELYQYIEDITKMNLDPLSDTYLVDDSKDKTVAKKSRSKTKKNIE